MNNLSWYKISKRFQMNIFLDGLLLFGRQNLSLFRRLYIGYSVYKVGFFLYPFLKQKDRNRTEVGRVRL
ncbi:hypothetical protein LQ50_15365 [Halalkalibacter okhensis]|uniref:Uncharacterized protein n=1 Tax=Halalkalibacter okhensis TaxID=333138 RepID=A0A0B0IIF4_9BACI|nr:hypothetical protein LQ50_15365 [Halalkalibacter okhensis]